MNKRLLIPKTLMLVTLMGTLVLSGCGKPAATTGTTTSEPPKPKYPEKGVEFIVHTNPGDGADLYARAISDAINTNKLMPQTMVVINKPGGSGANMYNYMLQKAQDPYSVMTAQANMLTSPITNKLPLSYKDYTPIARMAIDPLVVSVRADSKYKTMNDLINAAKEKPKAVTQAGGVAGDTGYFLSYMIEQATGVKFNLLPHRGGSAEAMITLLGGNADFLISQPGEVLAQVQAGKMRILATGTEKRLASLPEVPTLKEQGINAVFGLFRGVAMPKNVPQDTVAYMENTLKKVTESDSWKAYAKTNMIETDFLSAKDFKSFLDEQAPLYEKIIKSLNESVGK